MTTPAVQLSALVEVRPEDVPALYDWSSKNHIVSGVVTVDGSPSARRVAVIDRLTLAVVAVTDSNPDGSYRFSHLPLQDDKRLLVIALNDTDQYNAEVADFISPVQPSSGD